MTERPHCLQADACTAKGAGHCKSCNLKALWQDPAFRATRAASNARTLAKLRQDPAFRARESARALVAGRVAIDSGALHTPSAVAKRAATYSRVRMGWCPKHLREEYFALLRKKVSASEARKILEAQIARDAARQIEEFTRRQHERVAREKAQAYHG